MEAWMLYHRTQRRILEWLLLAWGTDAIFKGSGENNSSGDDGCVWCGWQLLFFLFSQSLSVRITQTYSSVRMLPGLVHDPVLSHAASLRLLGFHYLDKIRPARCCHNPLLLSPRVSMILRDGQKSHHGKRASREFIIITSKALR